MESLILAQCLCGLCISLVSFKFSILGSNGLCTHLSLGSPDHSVLIIAGLLICLPLGLHETGICFLLYPQYLTLCSKYCELVLIFIE